jgi:hypothetical protein
VGYAARLAIAHVGNWEMTIIERRIAGIITKNALMSYEHNMWLYPQYIKTGKSQFLKQGINMIDEQKTKIETHATKKRAISRTVDQYP